MCQSRAHSADPSPRHCRAQPHPGPLRPPASCLLAALRMAWYNSARRTFWGLVTELWWPFVTMGTQKNTRLPRVTSLTDLSTKAMPSPWQWEDCVAGCIVTWTRVLNSRELSHVCVCAGVLDLVRQEVTHLYCPPHDDQMAAMRQETLPVWGANGGPYCFPSASGLTLLDFGSGRASPCAVSGAY